MTQPLQLSEGFNGADLRNICTEAGMFAIRDEREYITDDDMRRGARKLNEVRLISFHPPFPSQN